MEDWRRDSDCSIYMFSYFSPGNATSITSRRAHLPKSSQRIKPIISLLEVQTTIGTWINSTSFHIKLLTPVKKSKGDKNKYDANKRLFRIKGQEGKSTKD